MWEAAALLHSEHDRERRDALAAVCAASDIALSKVSVPPSAVPQETPQSLRALP